MIKAEAVYIPGKGVGCRISTKGSIGLDEMKTCVKAICVAALNVSIKENWFETNTKIIAKLLLKHLEGTNPTEIITHELKKD